MGGVCSPHNVICTKPHTPTHTTHTDTCTHREGGGGRRQLGSKQLLSWLMLWALMTSGGYRSLSGVKRVVGVKMECLGLQIPEWLERRRAFTPVRHPGYRSAGQICHAPNGGCGVRVVVTSHTGWWPCPPASHPATLETTAEH